MTETVEKATQKRSDDDAVHAKDEAAARAAKDETGEAAEAGASGCSGRDGNNHAEQPPAAERRPDRARIPGLVLLLALLVCGILWTAAARFTRPVMRTAEDAVVTRTVVDAECPELRVDLNDADPAQLTLLPGIGPALAERIVADRAMNGPFERVEDLTRVKRIGPAIIDRLRPYATVE